MSIDRRWMSRGRGPRPHVRGVMPRGSGRHGCPHACFSAAFLSLKRTRGGHLCSEQRSRTPPAQDWSGGKCPVPPSPYVQSLTRQVIRRGGWPGTLWARCHRAQPPWKGTRARSPAGGHQVGVGQTDLNLRPGLDTEGSPRSSSTPPIGAAQEQPRMRGRGHAGFWGRTVRR